MRTGSVAGRPSPADTCRLPAVPPAWLVEVSALRLGKVERHAQRVGDGARHCQLRSVGIAEGPQKHLVVAMIGTRRTLDDGHQPAVFDR